MAKRILSIFVVAAMLVSCFAITVSAEDTRYEGVNYLQSTEDMLKELNVDSEASNVWDYSDRVAQQSVLNASADAFNADFTGANLVEKWDAYCDRILTRDNDGIGGRNGSVINYLKMLDISKTADASLTSGLLAVKNDFLSKSQEYNVAGLSLKDSFNKLDGYYQQLGDMISRHITALDNYTLTESKKTEYILKGTKALYQIAFQKKAEDMRNAFNSGFLGDDEGKKLIAVIYGKTLTSELARGNISEVIISYVNGNFTTVKNAFADLIKNNCGENTEKAVFTFLQNTVTKAYDSSSTATEEQKADIKMLFGDPAVVGDKGALQLMLETMDSSKGNNYGMINTWFNLSIRQHIQLAVSGVKATTLKAGVDADANRILVKNDSSAILNIEGIDRYGINVNSDLLASGSDWLDLKVYNEDHTPNTSVTYLKSEGKFNVTTDYAKDDTYPAYVQLVRNDGTYIETYPITVHNEKPSGGGSSGGGSGSVRENKYTISYVTNGGTDIPEEKHKKGEKVSLTKIPVKEGYIFEGWYSDPEFTKPINEIVISGNIVLYAKWVVDNGTAGGSHPTPGALNGDDHFAYVIGYPDGTVQPENNITRAEVATIFFRLLKNDIREANLTTDNPFVDVNDGEWYNMAISTLVKLGIVNGRTASEYAPNEPITRAEFATIAARFDDSDYIITDSFTDISAHWAVSYIREAAARGWIKGYEDGTFKPDRLITRAETMTLINRILNRAPESKDDLSEDMIKWIDNPESAWYYIPVQEATNSHTYTKKNKVYEIWSAIQKGLDWTHYQK